MNFDTADFMKIHQETPNLVKIGKKYQQLLQRPNHILFLLAK
jgi:hypothetical protein